MFRAVALRRPFFGCRRGAVLQSWGVGIPRHRCKVVRRRVCADGSFAVGLFRSANADTRNVPLSRYSVRLSQSDHPAHSRVCSNVAGAIFAPMPRDSHRTIFAVPSLFSKLQSEGPSQRDSGGGYEREGNYSIFRIGYWGIWFLKRVCIPGVLGLLYIRGILGFLFVQGFLC